MKQEKWIADLQKECKSINVVLKRGKLNPVVRNILQKEVAGNESRIADWEQAIKREKEKEFMEKNEPIANLVQWYANASRTMGCGGHGKAQRNEGQREYWKEVLSKRGVDVLTQLEGVVGIFNGEGSS